LDSKLKIKLSFEISQIDKLINDGKPLLKLCEPLEEYLKFRHFIRHAYGFQLEWLAMEDLVKRIENIWNKVKEDLNEFMC